MGVLAASASADTLKCEVSGSITLSPGLTETGQRRGVAAMAKAWSERLRPFDDYRTTGHDYRMLDEERILVFVAHTTHVKQYRRLTGVTEVSNLKATRLAAPGSGPSAKTNSMSGSAQSLLLKSPRSQSA